jgi:hypothetical protein
MRTSLLGRICFPIRSCPKSVTKRGVFIVLLVSSFTSTGCPQLNYWDGPSKDPFFRVADPVVDPAESTPQNERTPEPE